MKTKRLSEVVRVLRMKFVALIIAFTPCAMFLTSCDKDELEEMSNQTSNKVSKPTIKVLTKTSTYMDFNVAFKIQSDEYPKSVKLYYGRNSGKTDNPVINKSVECKFDKVILGDTYYYKATRSGFSGGDNIYFYGEVTNSAGKAKTDVQRVVIKRGM